MGFCSAEKNGSAKDVEDAIDNSSALIKEVIRDKKGFDDKILFEKIFDLLFQTNTDLVKAGICREDIFKRTEGNVLNREFIEEVIQNVININNIMIDKCDNINSLPEEQFILEHYLEDTNAVIYPKSINNLKNVYRNLMTIYNYYKETGQLSTRNDKSHIIIVRGIMSGDSCEDLFGSRKNPHSSGKAIDFKFDTISLETIYNDIEEGRITLEKGTDVILLRDSIHLGYSSNKLSKRISKLKKEEIF